MADPYRTAALRASRRPSLYVPEENPEAVAMQEYVQSKYDELMDPYRKFKQGIIQDAYNNVLQQTGDPKQAELAANSIAGKISRTEFVGSIVAPEAALAGAGRSIGAARDLASRVMGGSRAAEAPGAMRALPPPRRNAMYPDEMLAPEVIPMGGPSPNAPRLTYAKPETRYQMAVDRQAQGRSPTNYDRPEINEMFVRPEDVRSFSSGNIRGTVDPLDAMAAEGGPSSDAVELAQRIARQRAEGRAATVANEEARFAGGEGPNYAEEVLNQRRLAAEQRARAAEQEARFQSGQVDAMANEGGGAGRQATINDLERAARADFEARQLGTLGDEAGAITSGRNPPQQVARALQVVDRPRTIRGANNQTMSAPEFIGPPEMQGPRQVTPGNFIGPPEAQGPRQITPNTFIGPAERQGPPELIGPRQPPAAAPVDPVQAAINAAKQRADAMARSSADAAAQQAAIDAAAQRAGTGSGPMFPNYRPYSPPSMTVPLVGAGAIGAGALALNSGSQQVQPTGQAPGDAPLPAPPADGTISGEGYGSAEDARYDRAIADGSISGEQYNESPFAARVLGEAAGLPPRRPSAASSLEGRQAAARALAEGKQAPMRRPEEGFFSNLFANRPATTKQLFEQSQADPSDAGAWMRAERQYARTHKDDPNFDVTKLNDQGMKRGGAAGKSDSVHKALEIIHHLISSR